MRLRRAAGSIEEAAHGVIMDDDGSLCGALAG